MSRSLKKGPFVDFKLERKVIAMDASGKKNAIKTWARASVIPPEFVGHTLQFIMEINLFLFMLLKIWWVTDWASLHRQEHIEVMVVKEIK